MPLSLTPRRLARFLILFVILLAVWLRWWQLPTLPPGLWHDEAYNGMDARWLWQTASLQLFFIGNTGREPLLYYLMAPLLALLGNTPFAVRLVPSLVGIVTVAAMYRWMRLLFAADPRRHWLALLAAAGLTVSLWHVTMSRTGYRANLVPLIFIAMSCFFWPGWSHRRWFYFVAAGVMLGLSQYSYLSARLLPLVFVFFGLLWLLLSRRSPTALASTPWRTEFNWLLRGLLVVAVVSVVIFLPLGLYFWHNPSAFIGRANDIGLVNRAAQTNLPLETVAASQFRDALRVFFDGGEDFNWRHTLVGVAGFDWLMRLGFWAGLLVALRRRRQPRYLWLLSSLLVLWLPVLFSQVGTLRLAGFLAPYYALMAVGWVTVVGWVAAKFAAPGWRRWSPGVVLAALLLVSGGTTVVNYFYRWANQPQVYQFFNGQLVDLSRELLARSATQDLLLPFEVYAHPTMRFLLAADFTETATPSVTDRPVVRVDVPNMVDVPPGTTTYTYVWLSHSATGAGQAYTLPPFTAADSAALQSAAAPQVFITATGQKFARFTSLPGAAPLLAGLNRSTRQPVDYTFANQVRLTAFEVLPADVQPGQSPTLNLYWQNLADQPIPYTIVVQLIDGNGQGMAQWTDGYLTDQHRWRAGLITPTQHRLWLNLQAAPGPYLVQLSLFDYVSSQRAPVFNAAGAPVGDQVRLGLFYVSAQDNPRQPQTPLVATFGSTPAAINLLGVTLPPLDPAAASLPVRLYWQASAPLPADTTTFVQLLNAAGERVAGWDAQPLQGNYPISIWQPGEVVVDELPLPLPGSLPPGEYRLVTGWYNFSTGERLPAFATDGSALPGEMVVIRQLELP